MKVSFEGVGEQVLSFNKASGVTKGALVKMSANSTVKACDAGDRFMGVCIASGDAFAAICRAWLQRHGSHGRLRYSRCGRCGRQGQGRHHRGSTVPCHKGRCRCRYSRLHYVRRKRSWHIISTR